MQFLFLFGLINLIHAHGFLYSIGDDITVRGLQKLNSVIDDLRNPTNQVCRNEPENTPRFFELTSSISVKLAISKLATHIGECWVNIIQDNGREIRISPEEKCVYFIPDSECIPVPNSVTNDMCMQTWTFPTRNLDQITCTNCIFKWEWRGRHIEPNEYFNNCIDISVRSSSMEPENVEPDVEDVEPDVKPVVVDKPVVIDTPIINKPVVIPVKTKPITSVIRVYPTRRPKVSDIKKGIPGKYTYHY
jgi:hypothetical protein